MLRLVTLTGADDSVRDPNGLAELALEFPFLEFGILIGSNEGAHRFPSVEWIDWLVAVKRNKAPAMRLSLHVCGRPLREIATGRASELLRIVDLVKEFERTQLNFHGDLQDAGTDQAIPAAFKELAAVGWRPEIIFQLDGINNGLCRRSFEAGLQCAGLYDQSHGAGVSPKEWPVLTGAFPEGFAGGIGPDNVVHEIKRLEALVGFGKLKFPLWIDMETKLFDDSGSFSLEACRSVATQVAEYSAARMETVGRPILEPIE